MRKVFIGLSLCLGLPAVTAGQTLVPEPSAAPVSWQLDFRFQDPQRVSVVVPGKAVPVVYWYVLYSVENPTDQDGLEFLPEFELVTNTLQVIRSELKVSPEAFQAIQRRSNDPLLLTPERVLGKLQRGKDRARHSVAIFRDFDPRTTSFTIYVSGLAGEIKRVKNPAFDRSKPESETNKRYFLLKKTLAVPYKSPASPATRSGVVPERLPEQQKWILR